MFVNEFPIACNTKELSSNAFISIYLLLMVVGLFLNVVILVMLLFTGLYQKKPLQFIINLKDVVAISSYTSLGIFALIFHSLSEMVDLFCLALGIISLVTLIFDLLVKVMESIILLKILNATFVQNGPKYRVIFRVIFLLFLFTLIGALIFSKFLSIEKNVSISIKLKETLFHCVLFCFPKHHSILPPLTLIVILLTICVTINLKFVHSLRTHIFNMKCSVAKSLKHKRMITFVSSISLTTFCFMSSLCLLIFTLLFTSSFFISYSISIILWLYSMNNLSIFILSNKKLMENFKGCV